MDIACIHAIAGVRPDTDKFRVRDDLQHRGCPGSCGRAVPPAPPAIAACRGWVRHGAVVHLRRLVLLVAAPLLQTCGEI